MGAWPPHWHTSPAPRLSGQWLRIGRAGGALPLVGAEGGGAWRGRAAGSAPGALRAPSAGER